MKPAPFDYFAPTTVDGVHDLLNQYGDGAKILRIAGEAGADGAEPGVRTAHYRWRHLPGI
jgi:hypothetical protein